MSGGYSKEEIIENIRKTRSLEELHGLAYPPKNTMHKYAIKEAKAEIKRRLTGKRIKTKPKRAGMSMADLMRI
jgi:hypothetical protein